MEFNFKFILFTKLLLIVNLGIFGFLANNNTSEEAQGKKLSELNLNELAADPLTEWNINYERTIEYIKEHEGFAGGMPYICPGGYKTIGYGHVILEHENFEQLSENQADSLLRIDFNKALDLVEKNIDVKGSKKLAIAHFVFTRGIGTFIKSPLKAMVENNEDISEEIVKWCYYRNIKGERVRSQHAYNIRKWEAK
ncbi:MAG: lysozyme, partial [Chloroflexia bacterium]|nr:lysozyme [Chloroflexia bacterium]